MKLGKIFGQELQRKTYEWTIHEDSQSFDNQRDKIKIQ